MGLLCIWQFFLLHHLLQIWFIIFSCFLFLFGICFSLQNVRLLMFSCWLLKTFVTAAPIFSSPTTSNNSFLDFSVKSFGFLKCWADYQSCTGRGRVASLRSLSLAAAQNWSILKIHPNYFYTNNLFAVDPRECIIIYKVTLLILCCKGPNFMNKDFLTMRYKKQKTQ